ncbi:MAG: PKD domain containing protein [Catenulispora sp.]|nr:PKD domain containing protein [Catenulispora sp.]
MRRSILVLTAFLIALLLGVPATAAPAEGRISADPVDWTPHILDGQVWAMAVVGRTVVVGGDFAEVASADRRTRTGRDYLMAFSLDTGAVTAFRPDVDGPIRTLAAAPDGSVLAGGFFQHVNGVAMRGLVRLDVATGRISAGFRASVDGDVRAVVVHGGQAYVGGWFSHVDGIARKALARVDARTGAVDTGFDARLDAPEIGRTKVEDVAVSPAGDRLVVIGALTRALGARRAQIALLDVSQPRVKLADWRTDAYNPRCRKQFDTYMRAVDFAPDGRYFVVVTTGRMSSPSLLCDTAARFETYASGVRRPTWVNHTGGDSLYAVAVTGSAVYVGGHQRWLDNPYGNESAGSGAVSRPGISAIDPVSGKATAWNPTRTRGEGLRAFAVCPEGLLVGSDTDQLGHEYHGRIGLFPAVH